MNLFKRTYTLERTIYKIFGIKISFNNEKKVLKKMQKYGVSFCGRIFYKHEGIYSFGTGNKVILVKTLSNGVKVQKELRCTDVIKGLEILIRGNNNLIIIEEPQKFIETKIIITRDNNKVEIKSSKYKLEHSILEISNGNTLKIGKDFSVACDLSIIAMGKNGNVIIGDDCMFSGHIWIRDTDSHQILDKEDNIINFYEDVNIGNHVWCSHGAIITKGAKIPNNSIIGIGSVYTRSSCGKDINFSQGGYIFAGNPAKKLKDGIKWKRDCVDLIDKY